MQRVLLLDQSLYPIGIISWKKAFIYLFQEKAIALDFYVEQVRSPNKSFNIPKVLKLNSRHKKFELKPSSKKIKKRDGNICAYCGNYFLDKELSIDHIIPKASGKVINTWENLITSCVPCNMKKGGRTPEEANMTLIYSPRKLFSPIIYLLKKDEKIIFKDWITV